jgi:hypothetical protein
MLTISETDISTDSLDRNASFFWKWRRDGPGGAFRGLPFPQATVGDMRRHIWNAPDVAILRLPVQLHGNILRDLPLCEYPSRQQADIEGSRQGIFSREQVCNIEGHWTKSAVR